MLRGIEFMLDLSLTWVASDGMCRSGLLIGHRARKLLGTTAFNVAD
jgi:hypothetical protein